ncbi:rod shape-determining protein MreC [Motilibacter rhizosphaerae]|uniref:Cell shape-determining protein MreC n=1 Tax=Motilibacter rhizosphaerae TaxID=598652 RepID=A0A4Q7NSN2_9ACTN|nr:rod shape-determining protein MreC [Motilibacter rhizosphaerae]RZS89788.1 rod shape-determining protein MreC [Motilibacter rhizosphaerae]
MGRDSRRTRLVLTLLLLTSVTLLLLDGRSGAGSPLRRVRDAAGAVLGPVQRAVASAAGPPVRFAQGLGDVGSREDELRRLRTEDQVLRQQLAQGQDEHRRLLELERLTSSASALRIKAARVIALSPAQGFSTTATIDVGAHDGVRVDTTVVGPGASGQGLVGRVVAVHPTTATVLLATDPGCYVGVRRSTTGGLFGGVAGTGAGRDLELTGFDPDPVKVGESLVTAGSAGGRPFVKDVLVGKVVKVRTAPGTLTTRATVTPAVDFGRLDVVGVVVGQQGP